MLAFSEILKSQMTKKKKKHKSFGAKVLEKLTDIILIIVSVYIALLVEGWAEKRHEHKRLMQYYQSFTHEAKIDTSVLNEGIFNAKFHISNCNKIIKFLKKDKPDADSIKYYFSRMYGAILFGNSNMISYKSMITSGDMGLIEDLEMRRLLVELDESYYGIKLEEEIIMKYITNDLTNYYAVNFDLLKQKPLNPRYYMQIKFKNLIIFYLGQNQSRLEKYNTSFKLAVKVIKKLEEVNKTGH
jgi:hypothetical protein